MCVCVLAGYAIEQILPGMFQKHLLTWCFDMSEMFVSSLWKEDFDKLFTVVFRVRVKKRKSVVLYT